MPQTELDMKLNVDTSELDERLQKSILLVKELQKSIGELSESFIWVGQSLKIKGKEE